MEKEVNHFTDLKAWKKNHELVLFIYEVTKRFPDEEKFGLINQLRRAACSITANIAEGYGRYHFKDKIKFYLIARGSSTEVQDQLIISNDLGYLKEKEYIQAKKLSYEGFKIICGLIKSTNNLNNMLK